MKNSLDKQPKLTDDMAGKLLANVFDACGQEPNTIPLATLASYSEYRREKFSFQKVLLILVLVIFCLLPLCLLAPDFTVVRTTPDSAKLHTYEIRVDSKLPIKLVAASIGGNGVYVSEAGERTFTVTPTENGTMTVKVTILNRQYEVKNIAVSGVDITAPCLTGEERVGDKLYLYVKDDGLGINWDGIYAITNGGEKIAPLSYDVNSGYVCFAFPSESVNIYVPDVKDNTLQLVLTM